MTYVQTDNRADRRPWPMNVVGVVLAIEAVGAGVLVAWNLTNELQQLAIETAMQTVGTIAVLTLGLVLVVVGALVAIVTNLRRWRTAWQNAMLVQGLMLASGIMIYFVESRLFAYPLLLVGVIMVVYLMIPSVQGAFLPPAREDE